MTGAGTTVVVPARPGRAGQVERTARSWAAQLPAPEVLVCTPGARRKLHDTLAAALADLPGCRVLAVGEAGDDDLAVLWRAGADAAAGDVVVLADHSGRPEAGALAALRATLDRGAALAGLPALDADGSLAAAGAVPGADAAQPPLPILPGHPREDIAADAADLTVPLLASAPIAVRAATAARLDLPPGTSDPAWAAARLSATAGPAVLATSAGIRRAQLSGDAETASPPWPAPALDAGAIDLPAAGLSVALDRRGPAAVRRRSGDRLRWSIVVASPGGPSGDEWGDTHFAEDLARALRRHGQHAAVVRHPAAGRSARALDDVLVVLRGLERVVPTPGPVPVLWVISHPDLVEPDEARDYDLVFAASTTWSPPGRAAQPLLQATDPGRFNPDLAEPDTGPPVLFVGSSRGQDRPVVMDAVAVGADLTVIGVGWEGRVPESVLGGRFLPPDRVGAAYRAAGVVLNDHWEDMARDGFLSNRLFDAVAAGARVVSDPVPGLGEVFGDAVRVYHSRDELRTLLELERDALVGDDTTRRAASARIAAQHSFDARAEVLLERVRAALPAGGDG